MELIENAPDASALAESLRAFGYRYDAAIEDIMDNSLAAKAKRVRVQFDWDGRESKVSIIDDGTGMTPDELHQAMKLGARSPLDERDPNDLGRFGLGMKTASFSQARRLTVATRPADGDLAVAVWDLDIIRETGSWSMGREASQPAADQVRKLLGKHGTIVVWEKLDRLVGDVEPEDEKAKRAFLERVDVLHRILGVTYGRWLTGRSAVKLEVNGKTVTPWDPFHQDHRKTQRLPSETLPVGGGRTIRVAPFILPHHSHLTGKESIDIAGPRGFNAHQGLFIYRNKRLIVDGGWLDLGYRQEDHYKLARISIDLDNRDDHDWQIDVRKEQAKVPDALKADLTRIAKATRKRAEEVYRHRGSVIRGPGSEADTTAVWHVKKLRSGSRVYRLNRKHPLIKGIGVQIGSKRLTALLTLIQETLPVPDIALAHNREPDSVPSPFAGPKKLVLQQLAEELFCELSKRFPPAEALRTLGSMEPCISHPDLLAHIEESLRED